MKLMITIALFAFLLLPFPAIADIKTITHTVQQPFGGSQSPDDARTAGIARAKREALEQFGTYIESTTIVKDSAVDSDEILALTAGVTKAEVVKQKNYTDGDGFGLEITVKVELDTSVLDKSLKRLLEDRNHLKDLKDAREREKRLLAQIVELEKENQKKGKTKQQSAKLKKEFNNASQGLTAVEWFEKATALMDGGKYSDPDKAIEYLSQVIRLDHNYVRAYFLRGMLYTDLKQLDRAISDYDQLIRIMPKFSVPYNQRAKLYIALKQFDRAIADYNRVIRLDPHPVNYISRGEAYENLNKFDRALKDYNRAIQLDRNYPMYYICRGDLYFKLNKTQKGCTDLEKACNLGECDFYKIARQKNVCR